MVQVAGGKKGGKVIPYGTTSPLLAASCYCMVGQGAVATIGNGLMLTSSSTTSRW